MSLPRRKITIKEKFCLVIAGVSLLIYLPEFWNATVSYNSTPVKHEPPEWQVKECDNYKYIPWRIKPTLCKNI